MAFFEVLLSERLTQTFPNNMEQIMPVAESLEARGLQKGRFEGLQDRRQQGRQEGAQTKALEIAG